MNTTHAAPSRPSHTTRTTGRATPRRLVRGLPWLVLRQQRLAIAVTLLLAAGLTWYAVHTADAALDWLHRREIGTCPPGEGCRLPTEFSLAYQVPLRNLTFGLSILPVLAGVFLGAPLFATEVEAGTHRLILAQSTTRTRWFLAKVLPPVLLALLASVPVTWAAGRWRRLLLDHAGTYATWYDWGSFNATGPTPVARTLLLVSVGIALGLLLRRTITAMGASLLVGGGVFAAWEWARPYLRPAITARGAATENIIPDGVWVRDYSLLTSNGARAQVPDACMVGKQSVYEACLRDHDITRSWVEYHPQSHFAPLQHIETATCLALTVAALLFALYWTRTRLT
ncbi:hypothetical protein ACN20G_34105 (plasmid) [Streptomyces sp. BI20]|uniref:hypothetical protein n=1 Tax=Streptomyces sp. BI20 TaxID=3403460 RepID=UPI003C72021E